VVCSFNILAIAGLLCLGAAARGGPLQACGSQFDYGCASATFGGYTVISPINSSGSLLCYTESFTNAGGA